MAKATTNASLIVIFLDMDGVLLPFPDPSNVEQGRIFPNDTLTALSTILEAFQPDDVHYRVGIVLSSTWRVHASMRNEILEDFRAFGRRPLAKMEDFYGFTDPQLHTERQHEIDAWLQTISVQEEEEDQTERVAAWIALDDEELLNGPANALRKSFFEGHVIRCDSKVGLTHAQAVEAIQLLQNQLSQPPPPPPPR